MRIAVSICPTISRSSSSALHRWEGRSSWPVLIVTDLKATEETTTENDFVVTATEHENENR